MSNRKSAPLALTSLSLAMILCSGCLGSSEPQKSSRDMSSEERAEVETAKEQPKPESTPVRRTAHKRNVNAIAIEPHELDSVEVALMRVKRSSGNTLNIYWTYTNNSSEEKKLTKGCHGWPCNYRAASDAYIIDNVNQKKHLVVKADGKPITSNQSMLGRENTLEPGATINVWAKFPAPPNDIETISLYLPGIPPIEDVQITE
ncbi:MULTISPECIES: hypothetical protein [unclassified Prochlorococcus]|uniref:hypothetical protein n=1 Tax=unclassified Prochlorococcus TaxID=2627481 RepID=UPI0012692BE9|nr:MULTISPECIES: hypothetical protein [unclassified Prochlorococcus]